MARQRSHDPARRCERVELLQTQRQITEDVAGQTWSSQPFVKLATLVDSSAGLLTYAASFATDSIASLA
ncbi:MAG TPA: hypothetical protein VFP47_06885, partial [Pyrinomonadaceae bacterium]|nr:hypothetical protein [Pyrinomonadaceae bacterium]